MAQQQNDSLNQMPTSENTYMNDVTGKNFPQNGNNLDPTKNVSNMNESQKGKPSGPNGNSAAAGPVGMPPAHNDASSMHLGPYGHPMQHHHMPPEIDQQQQPIEHMYNPQAPPYGRHYDPNMPPMDMYGRYHPGGLEMKMPPNRPPPQRYPQQQQQPQTSASNQQQQQTYSAHPAHGPHSGEQAAQEQTQQPPNPIGQTPTLNSLLQSHQTAGPPQPHHHRYPNSYEQQSSQQPAYGAQTWSPSAAPQQRPYSPQMGQQAYRPPPPNANAARIHPSMSSYPPPPPQQNQTAQLGPGGAMQYSPYPQRYPTPPGSVATGTNHRPAYPASHQYPTDQSRPWPPPTGPAAQTTHGHAPHPPSPQHHVTAQSPVHAPSPSPQPPQPSNSPHQEICQNSNDSSAPGATTNTPNSMAMRPTPSPTGSSGSRSMSPAVPPQNHRPPYPHPGDQQQPIDPAAQQQRSPMIPNAQSATDFYEKRNLQANYPTPPSPHKYPPPPQAAGPNAMPPQGMPPYGSQSQQFPQGNYPARPQYPSNYGQVNGPANAPHVPNQNQYGRPMPNQTQFPQGNYATPPSPHMHAAYKGGAVNGPAPNAAPGGSPRPLNHLKQHLLHKSGYGNQSPTSPQSFVNGPGMHQPMGPPQMQAPTRMQVPGSMGPPYSPHHNSQAGNTHQGGMPLPESQDNGISSGSSASSQHPVTSIVTTGPDGTTIDEASQQSTISNASAASDPSDPQCSTPKRKTDYNQSHLASAGSTPTMHDDFEMGSPTWPRTPASPVFNSHTESTPHRSSTKQKSDSLCKLYEMDDSPERRPFLDKLLSFMEERRTPITACPTISKQPLDLYRLYTLVKERGGFVEVCKVTKSKIWKDVAGMLGIGASSSAAYTLRKHYTKNLLAFECHYDRGGIDPLPIIQQVESGSKKKTPKPASAPSPDANHKGSSNSQDSFQAAQIQSPPGSSSASMDSFNAYPPPPPQQQQAQQQPPTAGPNAPTPTAYPPQPAAAGAAATPQYPVEQQPYGPPTQQPPFQQPQQGQFAAPNRYPPYGEAPDARYNQHQPHQPPPPPPASQQATVQPPSATQTPTGPIPNAPPTQYPQAGPPPQQFEYRQQEPPPSRRHPDFTKESQYPPAPGPYNQRPQLYPNWQSNASPSHYNRQYPQAPQQWANQRLPGPPVMGAPVQNAQWEQHRYPPQNAQPPYPGNQVQPPQWTGMNQTAMGNVPNAIRPQQRGGQIPGKNIPGTMPPPQVANKPQVAPFPSAAPVKRDIVFPSDSVEAVTPLLYRRKRLAKNDIGQTDMWRIFMCLQSGLLSESTWALDVLNILLFDDSSVQWFSLTYLPGLLNMLLDHFQKSLTDMFDTNKYCGRPAKPQLKAEHKKRTNNDKTTENNNIDNNDNDANDDEDEDEDGLLKNSNKSVDLGQVTKPPNPNDRIVVLHSTTNYTMCSRKGIPVRIKEADDDIFVLDLKRNWDIHTEGEHQITSNGDSDAWTYGHNDPDPYAHIIDPFKGEFVNIPFARYLKSSDRKRKASNDESSSSSSTNKTATTSPTATTNDAPKSANDESKKSTVNSPKPSVKEEKVDENNDGPKVSDATNIDADKAVAIDGKAKEDIKSEPMEVDSNAATKKSDAAEDCAKTKANEPTKKEQSPVMDSDCREVDMELEKISNGPQSNEAAATPTAAAVAASTTVAATEPKSASENNESESKKSDETNSPQNTSFDVKKTIQDPAETLKRRRISDYEDECYARDEASLYLISENQDTLARRCLSISNILRNLTFVPGNETVFANSETFLAILGRILLLHHKHPVRTQTIRNYDREDDNDFSDSCSSLQGENEWWWDYLIQLRENMMVAVANIAGHMQLANYDELIARPCLDGLLHWAICPSAHGQDPFPSSGPNSSLSPQRLALEALCKICVTDANVDLVIATPPFSRLENLCSVLTRHLCRNEDQVLREFSVNLLHYLASAESSMARTVALQSPCISYLVAFIEQAEQTALGIANQHGINYLRENPDSMGTSLDMLRRTAGTLLHLARHPDNRPLFLQQEQRLLGLVMSHILDQQVALIISRVLFQVSRGGGSNESPVKKLKRRPLPHNNGKLAANTESSIPVS